MTQEERDDIKACIEKPMFGICIKCEEPISLGRMRIRPESVRCVECANLL